MKTKINKLNDLKQLDGKEETFQPTTIEQVLGNTGLNKYGTLNLEEYKQTLADMTKADLRVHAVENGIIPVDDRNQLENKLIKVFCSHAASFTRPSSTKPRQVQPSKEILKILSQGR